MIGSVDHFRPDLTAPHAVNVRARVPPGQLEFVGFVVGGQPGYFRVTSGHSVMEIENEGFSWDQDFFGPVLPVIPVPMAASSYRSEIELHLRATRASAPVHVVPNRIRIAPSGEVRDFAPSACGRLPRPANAREPMTLPLGHAVDLQPGQAIWLQYPRDNLATDAFDFVLPILDDVARAPTEVRLRFRRETSPFFAWGVF